jgi:hypothetical protein
MIESRRCLICGEAKGKKSLRRDRFLDMVEPCKKCREEYLAGGVLLVEVAEGEPWLGEEPNITGRIMVVKDEAFQRIFTIPLPPHKIAFVEYGVFEKILDPLTTSTERLPN